MRLEVISSDRSTSVSISFGVVAIAINQLLNAAALTGFRGSKRCVSSGRRNAGDVFGV
jgi:hypothetical protein